jgi:hypothetical protein
MLESFFKIVSDASIELPAIEVTVLLILMAVCLVSKHTRVGLVATYVFAYRWGWSIFAEHSLGFLSAYLFFGMITGILTVVALITDKHD